jgi:hypothetical protein
LQNGARSAVKFVLPLLIVGLAALPGNGNDKNPPAHGQLVDSGTFGIFMGGRRVGTEKFRIVQTSADLSTTTSEVTVDDGQTRAEQTSELEISSKGELVRYSWQEQAPGRAQTTVEPGDAVLMQHLTLGPTDKPVSQKYLLPASTIILDDYFFVHREVLVWRYLASVCRPSADGLHCQNARGEFPVLVPRQQTSASVAIDFGGTEETNVGGVRRTLARYVLHTVSGDPASGGLPDTVDWSLWLDPDKKLVRIVAGSIEVLRD